MTTTTLPSGTGIVSTYTYDDADRLTDIAHVKGGSTTVASVAYTLDDVGNRTQRVDQQGTHTYAYDDLHRLTSVTYPGPATTTYDFDAFGNREEMTTGAGTTTYDYDDADRLTQVDPPAASPVAYTWDDNGNLTDRGSDEFEWDFEDRMVEATVNSVTSNFTYRGDGLRNSRTVGGWGTVTFTWDIASGLPVVLDDGGQQYVYGAGLTSMKQSGNWFYYLADGLGSTMAVVNASGVSQKSYQYDVYGEVTGGSGSLSQEFDFAGQQTDASGLQYLRARYYDPETGTFLSRDPLADGPGWLRNAVVYASGTPTMASDPTGLCDDGSPVCLGATQCGRGQWCSYVGSFGVDDEFGYLNWFEYRQMPGYNEYRRCWLVGEYGKTVSCDDSFTSADIIAQKVADFAQDILDNIDVLLGGLDAANTFKRARELGHTTRKGSQSLPFDSHGQPGYYNPKDRSWITPDADAHNTTGGWKRFVQRGGRWVREGTYDADFRRIGD